jgi:hypothetical protein
MAALETFKASIIANLADGTAIVNDYGYTDDSSGTTHIDCGTGAGAFQTLVQATYIAALPSNWKTVRYRFACVGGTHKGELGFVEDATHQGALDSDNQLPAELCISMKRNTGHSSRRDRGRVFFGPVATDFINVDADWDKVPANPLLTAVANLGKAALTVGGVTLHPVILAADGTYSGRVVINVSIGPTFVHRRSRRIRVGA